MRTASRTSRNFTCLSILTVLWIKQWHWKPWSEALVIYVNGCIGTNQRSTMIRLNFLFSDRDNSCRKFITVLSVLALLILSLLKLPVTSALGSTRIFLCRPIFLCRVVRHFTGYIISREYANFCLGIN